MNLMDWARRRLCLLLYGTHDGIRHPLGGFRCSRCGAPAADLGEKGFGDNGYVPKDRVQFTRERTQSPINAGHQDLWS